MAEIGQITLNASSILNVPLESYEDFYFIVNNQEFKTSKIIADLLSSKICQIHKSDPTFNKFTINTSKQGDFSNVLKLVNFKPNSIPETEFSFISEIIELLGNEYIEVKGNFQEITMNNVIELVQNHQKYEIFFSQALTNEIDFISSHFYRLLEREEDMTQLNLNVLERIINNPKLKIKDEDQLLSFINELYFTKEENAPLYEYVLFENVGAPKMSEFLNIYNFTDITNGTWQAISSRLKQKINKIYNEDSENEARYVRQVILSLNI